MSIYVFRKTFNYLTITDTVDCGVTIDCTPALFVTVRLNISVVPNEIDGAMNVGVAVFAPLNATVIPDVCTHE
jgi:hypothetical protein